MLAAVKESKGFCSRIFNSYDITYDKLAKEIYMTLNIEESDMTSSIPFSDDFKRILQRTMDLVNESGNSTVHYEHIVLALINDKHSKISTYLENLGFDIDKSRPLIEKLVQRKSKNDLHPEIEENKEPELSLFDKIKFFDTPYDKLACISREIGLQIMIDYIINIININKRYIKSSPRRNIIYIFNEDFSNRANSEY